jgi:glycosyltransferase involved in cell wall biosynthesis
MKVVHVCQNSQYEGWGYQENFLTKPQVELGHQATMIVHTTVHLDTSEIAKASEMDHINKNGVRVIRVEKLARQVCRIGSMVEVARKQSSLLLDSVMTHTRTNSQEELAQFYSIADVFVNPTREDNFPTVHLEALACGTPFVTYDVGGSAEMLNTDTGLAVKPDDFEAFLQAIILICERQDRAIVRKKCVEQAQKFSDISKYKEYITLYGK